MCNIYEYKSLSLEPFFSFSLVFPKMSEKLLLLIRKSFCFQQSEGNNNKRLHEFLMPFFMRMPSRYCYFAEENSKPTWKVSNFLIIKSLPRDCREKKFLNQVVFHHVLDFIFFSFCRSNIFPHRHQEKLCSKCLFVNPTHFESHCYVFEAKFCVSDETFLSWFRCTSFEIKYFPSHTKRLWSWWTWVSEKKILEMFFNHPQCSPFPFIFFPLL